MGGAASNQTPTTSATKHQRRRQEVSGDADWLLRSAGRSCEPPPGPDAPCGLGRGQLVDLLVC
jgi:hypothetical protein